MNAIFIHCSHDGSMTIVINGEFHAHVQLDRYNRIKNDSVPSYELLQYLKSLKIDFDLIYFTQLFNDTLRMWYDAFWNWKIISKKTVLKYDLNQNHHIYHKSCSTNFTSTPFIYVSDGHGSVRNLGDLSEIEQINLYFKESRSWGKYIIRNNLTGKDKNHGLGHPYQIVANQIFNKSTFGNIRNNNLMALSDYGTINLDLLKLMEADKLVDEKFNNSNIEDKTVQDACATLQEWFEIENLKIFRDNEVNDFVTLTGGCAQNIKANTRFLKEGFKIEVDPLCTDQGISLGLAKKYLKKDFKFNHVYLGIEPKYNLMLLNEFKIIDVTENEVSEILINNPVGIFQGKSEQGQRGLGNRSLLGNPFDKNIKYKINKIKKRDWYRPFAASVLEEDAKEYFNMLKENSPFMLFTFDVNKKYVDLLSSVSSVKKNCRVQTVTKNNNINFYNLLKCFKIKNKHSIVLNTSLNLPGLPLVENLNDLLYLLKNSGLKYVYLPDVKKLIINENIIEYTS
jgi:predicted NodU family carbamoyl transferase